MNLGKIKSLFLKSLIGCLIAAALLAVATILTGHFNEVSTRALFTILLIALHCLVSFSFIVNNEKQKTFDSLSFFSNATFIIIVLSFITSVLGVWSVLPGEMVGKLYAAYFVLLFATLHGEVLAKTAGKQKSIDNVVYANYIFMLIVVVMLMVVIFLFHYNNLGSFFYRLLAACGIIDATLTLIAVILHKLYVQKHPTIDDAVFNGQQFPGQINPQYAQISATPHKRGLNIFVTILIIYVTLQILGSILIVIISTFRR